jgi:hypothetical protein
MRLDVTLLMSREKYRTPFPAQQRSTPSFVSTWVIAVFAVSGAFRKIAS